MTRARLAAQRALAWISDGRVHVVRLSHVRALRRWYRQRGWVVAMLGLAAGAGLAALATSHPRARAVATTTSPGLFAGGPFGGHPPSISTWTLRPAPRLRAGRAPLARPAPSPLSGIERLVAGSGYLRLGGAVKRDVALTFDDGPSPFTPLILRILERTHTPATFFTVGRMISVFGASVAREARDGFDVGDHTETHPFLSFMGAAFQMAQITDDIAAVTRAGAPAPRLFRPPYGAFDHTTLTILHALRMAMVLWSVDTSDYLRPGMGRIVAAAVTGARPGAVILMHDGGGDRSQTVAALPTIIAWLRRHGYRLVTVSRMLVDDPPPAHQPPPQPLSGVV